MKLPLPRARRARHARRPLRLLKRLRSSRHTFGKGRPSGWPFCFVRSDRRTRPTAPHSQPATAHCKPFRRSLSRCNPSGAVSLGPSGGPLHGPLKAVQQNGRQTTAAALPTLNDDRLLSQLVNPFYNDRQGVEHLNPGRNQSPVNTIGPSVGFHEIAT